MTTELNITLPVPPLNNRWFRHWARGGHAMTYLSPEAIAYKKAVAEIVDADPIDGPLALSMTVYRARKAGDADAYLKGCMDSLNGLAWNDDSQLVQLHVYRRDDKAAPRIEVRIWSVSE